MPCAQLPADEQQRLASLLECRILDTAPERVFDDLTTLAARLCDTPIALVSFVDTERQWFKSAVGTDAKETHRDSAFCAHAILGHDALIVANAATDPRTLDNPLVLGPPHIRFYAGIPLGTKDGHALGTLCVIDVKPREISSEQLNDLQSLALQVTSQLELRRLNRSLSQSQSQLQAVVQGSTQVSIIATDLDGMITVFNSGAERMLGYTAEEMIDRRTPETIHLKSEVETRSRQLSAEFGYAVTGFETFVHGARLGGHGEADWTYVRKDGSHLTVRLVVTATRDETGNITGFVGVATDISARKESEDELVKARVMADTANRSKSEFLANMSHEIRTPLTSILGYADLLSNPGLNAAEIAGHVATINSAGSHLLTIINDVLDLSKIEAGRMTIERIEMSPSHVIREVVSVLQPAARAKGLDIDVQSLGSIPNRIVSDPVRVRQILMNLVGNAIKFTECGHVRLTVQVVPAPPGGIERLAFEVTDTGIGMSAEQCESLFEPFMQADLSTTRKFGGTGLGLTICRRMARILDGEITASSEPGLGSTFRVTLATGSPSNVEVLESVTVLKDMPLREAPRTRETKLCGRILVAEDNPVNRRLVEVILKTAGATVDVAENGQIAVDRVAATMTSPASPEERSTGYDMVLMDMQMPVLDGYDATQRLRELGYQSPVVALTAHAMAEDRSKCLAAGCDDFATKPLDRDQLIRKCHDWIETGGSSYVDTVACCDVSDRR